MNKPPEARNHRNRWTIPEMKYLEDNYRNTGLTEISDRLGRTPLAIKRMAKQLGCTQKKSPEWSTAEKAILSRYYESHVAVKDIAAMLPGRKSTTVMAMAAKMGLSRPYNIWTADEIRCLQHNYPREGQKVMHRLPGKADQLIRKKVAELGISPPSYTIRTPWSTQEWLLLDNNRDCPPLALLPLFPDRTLSSIKNALQRLKKS